MKKVKVSIFGSTGSIGTTTLKVVRENPEIFTVETLVARSSKDALKQQIEEFYPHNVYIFSEEDAREIEKAFPELNVYYGDKGLAEISKLKSDIGVSALVGIAGLLPTYYMIQNCNKVVLANKEVLVTGGEIIMNLAKSTGVQLLTADSEHSAIMQCLQGEEKNKINKILLTASGGPFFDKEITEEITPEQALNHPTWKMGPKVTIDSATMMNKGFEVIEARWLFDTMPENIQVVVHRKSLLHSAVQFEDGTIMANIGPKDMQIPIAYALNYPVRLRNNIQMLDLFEVHDLSFEKPDLKKFECLSLAYQAIESGHSHQVVLNVADEVVVDAFLKHQIKFTDIPKYIRKTLESHEGVTLNTISDILELDREVRTKVKEKIRK